MRELHAGADIERGGLWQKTCCPFEVAREIFRKLDLRSQKEWWEWSKAPGQWPANIPSLPSQVYRDTGLISTPDWLALLCDLRNFSRIE